MKVEQKELSIGKVDVISYDSLNEFYEYIINTPLNKAFRWHKLSSIENSESFSGTSSFEEATELFKNGYKEGSSILTNKLKVEETKFERTYKRKTAYGMQGYQPCVPLYLNGVPNNMITTKMQVQKQKIVVLNKDISYSGYVDKQTIERESIKAFKIIRKLESQGYRCELNVVLGTISNKRGFACRTKIKGANERLNVSKMAFPLIHPSMLRRLYFRFIETYPEVTTSFTSGYGSPISEYMMKSLFDGEFLSKIINVDVNKIKNVEDLHK